ncbi:MAG: hypothetical protein KDI06_13890 [Calditrichaeota bacterium]|nr:hypothetical protein [Calditrichota bacterium]
MNFLGESAKLICAARDLLITHQNIYYNDVDTLLARNFASGAPFKFSIPIFNELVVVYGLPKEVVHKTIARTEALTLAACRERFLSPALPAEFRSIIKELSFLIYFDFFLNQLQTYLDELHHFSKNEAGDIRSSRAVITGELEARREGMERAIRMARGEEPQSEKCAYFQVLQTHLREHSALSRQTIDHILRDAVFKTHQQIRKVVLREQRARCGFPSDLFIDYIRYNFRHFILANYEDSLCMAGAPI